jgi:ABC-type amino acid transport system permease subunit
MYLVEERAITAQTLFHLHTSSQEHIDTLHDVIAICFILYQPIRSVHWKFFQRAPGTPGVFSISETLKRHKRQTATGRDKCTLMISKPLLGIIADIHNTAVGILLMLIRFIENDLIAKKRSYFIHIFLVCLVCLLCLTRVYPFCLLCLLLSYSRQSETQ